MITDWVAFWRGSGLLGLTGIATNLGDKQVNTKGSVLVVEVALELGNLLLEHLWGVSDTADDAHAAGVGDGSRQLGTGGDVHAGQQDGVLDLEKISDGSADLLCLFCATITWLAGAESREIGEILDATVAGKKTYEKPL